MAQYRSNLPQLGGDFFITDGGLETTLIFHEGIDLPDFAAFHLLKTPAGTEALRKYYQTYASLASRMGVGVVLESATWRASSDWGARLGYTERELADANRRSITLLEEVRSAMDSDAPIVISGCIGPRGDGYTPSATMTEAEAEVYHREQVESLATTTADMVCAITMNYIEETIGIVRAAERAEMPVAVSFTVETDGRLPTGESLESAIRRVDEVTRFYPVYYMINCAHPTHFDHALDADQDWTERIRGIRANASQKSHSELNESVELDTGDAVELASQYVRLKSRLPQINVMGGCCGTDDRHVQQIAGACIRMFRRAA